jgi:hypothetical protein
MLVVAIIGINVRAVVSTRAHLSVPVIIFMIVFTVAIVVWGFRFIDQKDDE